MIPPPPPKRRQAPPPPPASVAVSEPLTPPISPDLTRVDFEYAVWVHGGYPQVEWPSAVRELYRKCRSTALGQICAAAIYELDRKLPKNVNLTMEDF